jgi:transcriptional regulator with XRE-family HTH domain
VPATPDNVFGKTLQECRKASGMTNAESLAAALGVSASSVKNWEQGSHLPEGESAWKLHLLFGPSIFRSLMPHVALPAGVKIAIEQPEGAGDAYVISRKGSKVERLSRAAQLAAEIAAEPDV